MKRRYATKILSLTMVLVFTASSASCSQKKREYRTIVGSDPWYECSSFEVSDLYPDDAYEFCNFETVGTSDDSVYIRAEALRLVTGDYKELSEEDYIKLYEQSILEFSFDGRLKNKTDFDPVVEDGVYKSLQKAWIYDGELNLLEEVFNKEYSSIVYYLNGRSLMLPDVPNYYNNPVFIEDIYTSDGYVLYKLYVNSWSETFVLVRPDGSFENIQLELVLNSMIDGTGDFIPAGDGKVMLPVYLSSGEEVFLSIDPVTGETAELEGLYGTNSYMLEYSSGKTVARDFSGISTVDMHTGDLEHVFDYADVDGLLCDVMDSQTLYIADDGSEIILGCETYSRYSSSSGYKIMHLSRAASNPNAGKTELIVTTNEGFYPERSDFIALQKFNQNNGSFFLKYEFPMEEDGRFKDIDADIYLTYDPSQELSDKNRFMDLAPYLDLGSDPDNGQFFANAIYAAKNGDCIYHVPLDISACGIFTASSNVPQGQTGFTFQSYVEFVDNVCNGVDPMSKTAGYMMGKAENFTRLFMSMSDLFICDGKAHLDNEEMRELMLFVDEYGSDVSLTEEEIYKPIIEEHNEEIQAAVDALEGRTAGIEGRSGAKYGELCSFDDYISFYVMYGQELGFYGLPSFDGRGPMTISHEFVSVSSGSLYPDACVEFVNLLLSYDIQKNMDSNPVNREAFRTAAEEKLSLYNKELDIRRSLGLNVTERIPEDAVGKYTEILNSSKGIANAGGAVEQIVREESSSYFSGGRSMDDVIPVMQKRIQTVLDETA